MAGGVWPAAAAVSFLLLTGGAAIAMRNRPGFLTGQLAPLAGPDLAPLPLALDLSSSRSRHFAIGKGGKGEWRLPGWDGAARLACGPSGETILMPVRGAIAVNGIPASGRVPLHDGDKLTFGAYHIRYENLLT